MIILLILSFASIFNFSYGCQMEGVTFWQIPIPIQIKDIDEGVVFTRAVSDIQGVHDSRYGEATVGGPYFDIDIVNNQFIITTNEAYRRYEHNEVSANMDLTVEFNCVGGGQQSLLFLIEVQDTNNNDPEFLPSDFYEFVLAPPLPPNFILTGCGHEIIARDIDLTTQRIHFGIEENDYFEIEYDEDGSDVAKEFKAILRTTSLVRNLREPIELRISATDEDLTDDEPRTTYGTLRVSANSEFDLPDDLLFSQTFYLANYTVDDQLNLLENIVLSQGFDEHVKFELETDGYDNNFELIPNGEQLDIIVTNPLPVEVVSGNQIYLIVKADREYTSGATATVVIQLPEVTALSFEHPLYYGKIENGALEVPPLELSQGYEDNTVTAQVVGEYSTYFTADVQDNFVTLTMHSLPDQIIENNNFLSLEVEASSIVSKSNTIVSLDIIKDDNVTPVFDKSIYTGTYDTVAGLTVEQIEFVQGFDGTVDIELFGDHKDIFTINRGSIITITASEIPEELFVEHNIVLWIEASKARTVGANAAIIIALPAVTVANTTLVFEQNSYIGSITSENTNIPTIVLIEGYSDSITFSLHGDLSNYFRINWEQEVVTVSLPEPIPEALVPENKIIVLNIRAVAPEITSVYTTLVIDYAIHEEESVASFDKVLFEGVLQDDIVTHDPITLSGFTGTEVELLGEHASLFEALLTNNLVTVTRRVLVTLPVDINHVVLELVAGTARAVLVLNVHDPESPAEPEASFDKVLFEGDLRSGVLSHETITLSGYNGVTVDLIGEHATLFEAQLVNDIVTITGRDTSITLPSDLTHFVLELVAGSARAVLLINVHSAESPSEPDVSFNKVVLEGILQNGVVSHETITLTGFTGTNIELFGEFASLFEAQLANNVVTVTGRVSPITLPSDFAHLTLELVAGSARAVLVLSVHNAEGPIEPDVSFNKVVLEGLLQDGVVSHETITLSGFTGTNVDLFGEYASLFEAQLTNNLVTVTGRALVTLPAEVTNVVLELAAGTARAALLLNVHNTESPAGPDASFDKILFEGDLQNGVLSHEIITLSGYDGVTVDLIGEHATLFEAQSVNNIVTVTGREASIILPSDLTHFALELVAGSARAVLLINILSAEPPTEPDVSFNKVVFEGILQNGIVSHETITLTGFTATNIELFGEFASLFEAQLANNVVTVTGRVSPITLPSDFAHLTLELVAGSARAVLVLSVHNAEGPIEPDVSFNKVVLEGLLQDGVVSHETITLSGFTGTNVDLFGEYASLFEAQLTNNLVTVTGRALVTLPAEVTNVVLELAAGTARAVLLLNVYNTESPAGPEASFDKVLFEGDLRNSVLSHEKITLSGYDGVTVDLIGEHATLFEAQLVNDIVTVTGREVSITLPSDLTHFALELVAGSARAVLLINVHSAEYPTEPDVSFNKVVFEGILQNGVVSHETITLTGFTGTNIELFGEFASLFEAQLANNVVTVTGRVSPITLPSDFAHLTLELVAGSARAVLVLSVHNAEGPIEPDVSFNKVVFEGLLQDGVVSHETITLSGFTGTNVALFGEYASLFEAQLTNNIVTVTGRALVTLPAEVTNVVLELAAGTARAVLLLNVHNTESPAGPEASFDKVLFEGDLRNGVLSHETITLSGYDGVTVDLIGEHATLFEAQLANNIVTVTGREASIILPSDLTHFVLELAAGSARAVLLINVHSADPPSELEESFSKVLYEGFLLNGIVVHETITLSAYTSVTNVEIVGEYASLFTAHLVTNIVFVTERAPVTLPAGVTNVALELAAGTARAVLVLNVRITESLPPLPIVTFSAESYALRVEISQTGIIGQVVATADNGEAINYSLQFNNSHLEERLSINNEGELRLSAPVSGGFYAFQVEGTTVFTEALGTATVYLSVEAVTVCGEEFVMPPLIVLDHDEEEPHNNLVETQREGCHFELTNRWPLDQNWLYVDENGLHASAIDREHETIAFMPVSQIQVEITLICDTDSSRIKRSLTSDLGPYDYGLNKWILTDTILYNSRKSLVNLIVNDINDNSPIFVNKDSEPIAVGYPIPELQQFVLPRALTQLHATDADIGENAAIVYWSENPELAVAPLTGFVHIRDETNLEQDALMTVHATDRNGDGLTGSIDIIVKLLDESNIAVVTVNDAFLDDETDIVSYLSGALGYEVKVLRSIVVPQDDLQDDEIDGTRTKREVTRASGASLQLYVYGIEQREPVSVDRLTTDINNSASETVNVANTVSLEDHLASLEICTARDTGLLVATIVLAVLLFIVAALIALWFFLRWRRKNYDQFSDENSLASRNESIGQAPKSEVLPRLNIEELKKSERRLQEMLETPIEEVKVEGPAPAINNDLIKLSSKPNSPIINSPIVIQSIDKLKDVEDSSDDEFGEVQLPRRKSVVTFNENVEKIIHVEDNDDSEDLESVTDTEVYKF